MSKHYRKSALRIFSGKSVRICEECQKSRGLVLLSALTSVADSCIVYFNADLMRLWHANFDFFDREIFSCLPRDGGFAVDWLRQDELVMEGESLCRWNINWDSAACSTRQGSDSLTFPTVAISHGFVRYYVNNRTLRKKASNYPKGFNGIL